MKTTLVLAAALVFALGGFASSQNLPQRNIDTCLSGKYPALCDHGALTPEQLRQARVAEQRENLRVCMTTCMDGRYPSLCKHALPNSRQAQER